MVKEMKSSSQADSQGELGGNNVCQFRSHTGGKGGRNSVILYDKLLL